MTKPKAEYSLSEKPELGLGGWPLVMPNPNPKEFHRGGFHDGMGNGRTGTCRCLLGWIYQSFIGDPTPPYQSQHVIYERYPALAEFKKTVDQLCKEATISMGKDTGNPNNGHIVDFNDMHSTYAQRAAVWRKALQIHSYTANVYREAA